MELSQVDALPSCASYQIPFRHLCNLLQTNAGDIEAVIASLPDVKAEQLERLRTRAKCAWYWITECAPEDFRFALRTDGSKAELAQAELSAVIKLRDEVVPKMDGVDEKGLSELVYAVAGECGLEPKALFTATYQALIGKDQGPRLANFMKIIGKDRLTAMLSAY